MMLSEYQNLLQSLPPRGLERFVADVIRGLERFREVQLNSVVNGMEIDIVAKEKDTSATNPVIWVFEVKASIVVGTDVVRHLAATRVMVDSRFKNAHLVLVVAGQLTSSALSATKQIGIETWDCQKLLSLAPKEVLERYFGQAPDKTLTSEEDAKGESLLKSLDSTEAGKKSWSAYQKLSSDIVEYLFCPPLESPRYEVPDVTANDRRDMILENGALDGFWAQIRQTYKAEYVVVDAKNYSAPIKKGPVIDVAHYLKPYGCGLFGILLCRKGPSSSALHAIRGLWIGSQKLIVVLADKDVAEMIKLKRTGGKPEELLRRIIADFRMAL